jgi:serine phosphatase RsbU (regulator of sigma subunit)/CheY-like chemotaxis protein
VSDVTPDLDEVTLLLVDDTPENLVALEATLAPLGHHLLLARSGEEALRHLLSADVAVILLDVRMPGMDGYETARHIKERERTRDIPIVFLTAFGDDPSAVAEGFSSGAVDYLTKPLDPVLLRAKVQVLVDLHLRTRALQHESEVLSQRLDDLYAAEARNLRKLADAALVINSTHSLGEMLRVIDGSAREVCGARSSQTVITDGSDLSPLLQLVWDEGTAVRMTAKDVEAAFGGYGVMDVAAGLPILEGWLAVPLVGRTGRRLGLLHVSDKVQGDFTESDEVVLTQLAQLAAVAIENAERFQQEHDIAETLQRSLLPKHLPRVRGVEVAVRYRPGGLGTSVGGDWYDVIPLDDGRVALSIGDIMGRGTRAAAVMGQVRTALRAYALQDLPPGVTMRSLDRLLQDLGEDAMATAALLVLDPVQRRLEVVSAGHPPPLLVERDGTASFVECEPHTPLGVIEAPIYQASVRQVPAGALLLLYTDGLVEERDENLADGLERLRTSVDASIERLDELCDSVLEKMVPGEKNDDIALLVCRLS